MNCQRFEDVVLDLARAQMIEVSVREEALEHAHECKPCERRLEDERHLTLRLRCLASSATGAAVPEPVEARLIEAFESYAVLRTRSLAMMGRKSWAAAAALLIVAGLLGIRWRLTASVTPVPGPSVVTTRPSGDGTVKSSLVMIPEPPSSVIAALRPPSSSLHRRTVRGESKAKPASANDRNREIATGFIPLNYGGVSLDEGGRVVRVELPRSAMANFGLPVNMNRANERVKADVLFGVDGLAHSIRFVQ